MSAITEAASVLSGLAATISKAYSTLTRGRVTLAISLSESSSAWIDGVKVKLTTKDGKSVTASSWIEYAETLCPDDQRPSLYRLANAGAVARVLGAESVGEASVGTLVPLYRVLAQAKTPEAREAADTLIRELWAKAQAKAQASKPPRETDVTKLVEGVMTKGTRGKAKAKPKASGKAKASDAPTVPVPDGSEDREACMQAIRTSLGRIDEDLRGSFLAGVLAGVKLRETYSAGTVEAITKTLVRETKQAATKAQAKA